MAGSSYNTDGRVSGSTLFSKQRSQVEDEAMSGPKPSSSGKLRQTTLPGTISSNLMSTYRRQNPPAPVDKLGDAPAKQDQASPANEFHAHVPHSSTFLPTGLNNIQSSPTTNLSRIQALPRLTPTTSKSSPFPSVASFGQSPIPTSRGTPIPSKQILLTQGRRPDMESTSTYLSSKAGKSYSPAPIQRDVKPIIGNTFTSSTKPKKEGTRTGQRAVVQRHLAEEDAVAGMLHLGGVAGWQKEKEVSVIRNMTVKVGKTDMPFSVTNLVGVINEKKEDVPHAVRRIPHDASLGGRKGTKPNSKPAGVEAKTKRKEAEEKKKKKRMRRRLTVEERVWQSSGDEATSRYAEDTDEEDRWRAIDKRNKEEQDLDEVGMLDELEADEAPGGYWELHHIRTLEQMDKDELQKKKKEKAVNRVKAKEDKLRQETKKAVLCSPQATDLDPAVLIESGVAPIQTQPMSHPAIWRDSAPKGWVVDNPNVTVSAVDITLGEPRIEYPDSDDSDGIEEFVKSWKAVLAARPVPVLLGPQKTISGPIKKKKRLNPSKPKKGDSENGQDQLEGAESTKKPRKKRTKKVKIGEKSASDMIGETLGMQKSGNEATVQRNLEEDDAQNLNAAKQSSRDYEDEEEYDNDDDKYWGAALAQENSP